MNSQYLSTAIVVREVSLPQTSLTASLISGSRALVNMSCPVIGGHFQGQNFGPGNATPDFR
jgi:hypothetical protein